MLQEVRARTKRDDPIPSWMLEPSRDDHRMFHALGAPATVFLDEEAVILSSDNNTHRQTVEGAYYQYLDHLTDGYGAEAMQVACEAARAEVGNDNTAEYFELMLQKLFDRQVRLHHIQVIIGRFVGNHTHIYGVTFDNEQEAE